MGASTATRSGLPAARIRSLPLIRPRWRGRRSGLRARPPLSSPQGADVLERDEPHQRGFGSLVAADASRADAVGTCARGRVGDRRVSIVVTQEPAIGGLRDRHIARIGGLLERGLRGQQQRRGGDGLLVESSRMTTSRPPARIAYAAQVPVRARLRLDEPVEDVQSGPHHVRAMEPATSDQQGLRQQLVLVRDQRLRPGPRKLRLAAGEGLPQIVRHPSVDIDDPARHAGADRHIAGQDHRRPWTQRADLAGGRQGLLEQRRGIVASGAGGC